MEGLCPNLSVGSQEVGGMLEEADPRKADKDIRITPIVEEGQPSAQATAPRKLDVGTHLLA